MNQPSTPTTTPTLDAADPRAHFATAVASCASVIDGTDPTQYDAPTPCGEMTAAQLMEHLVMVIRRVACAGHGDDPWTWPVDAADVAAGEWGDAWRSAAHDVQAAWADPALLERDTALPWGVFSGAEVLDVYTNEVTVHTWDLARATGQDPQWDDDVLGAALVAIHHQLPDADRTAMWAEARAQVPPEYPWEDPFANAVEVAVDAPLIDRLVAWNGRTP